MLANVMNKFASQGRLAQLRLSSERAIVAAGRLKEEEEIIMHIAAIHVTGFDNIPLGILEALTDEELDALAFGVIGLSADCLVEIYNQTESRLAGLSQETVLGSHFFLTTAQCMNNFMVAQRFEDEVELDTIIDFVLTLRMRPTPVRLRLLQSSAVRRRYILVDRTKP